MMNRPEEMRAVDQSELGTGHNDMVAALTFEAVWMEAPLFGQLNGGD